MQTSVALQQKEAACPPIAASLSIKYTLTPLLANSNAEVIPLMPPPITQTDSFIFQEPYSVLRIFTILHGVVVSRNSAIEYNKFQQTTIKIFAP